MRSTQLFVLNFFLIICVLQLPAVSLDEHPSVTDDCLYCELYGKHFRTRMDLYLFQETGEPGYKYFGVSNRGKVKPRYLPAVISKNHVGHIYATAKILAVVPAGSEFVVEAATHDVSVSSGETLGLMCRLFYNGREIFPVSAEFIEVHTLLPDGRQNPDLDMAIAERVTKK